MDTKAVEVKKGKTQQKVISSIQELPTDWKLLTNTTDEKNKFFIKDDVKKHLAILEVTYVEQEVSNKYIQFIGIKDTLISAEINTLRKSLNEKGINVYFSNVEKTETKIIDEIYKTSKDEGQSDDKDYSVETGVPKEVNDLFIKAVTQGVSDIHLEVRKGFARIRARTNGRITNFYATSFAESTGYEWGRESIK